MPPWILDVSQDVDKYDVGIKISRGEFKLTMKDIKWKWICCIYWNHFRATFKNTIFK